MVAGDHACIKCSYNLRGLPMAGPCPECGTPVNDSLDGFLLQRASPAYLASIASGLSLVLNGILLDIVLAIIHFVAVAVVSAGKAPPEVVLVTMALQLIPAGMLLLGYLRYTVPDPDYAGLGRPGKAREILRVLVILYGFQQVGQITLGLLGATLGGLKPPSGSTSNVLLEGLFGLLFLGSGVIWIVQFFCVLNYTNWLANRVPDVYVDKMSKTFRWLLPVLYILGIFCFGLGPLIALILFWSLLDRMRKHVRSIRATGQPAVFADMY